MCKDLRIFNLRLELRVWWHSNHPWLGHLPGLVVGRAACGKSAIVDKHRCGFIFLTLMLFPFELHFAMILFPTKLCLCSNVSVYACMEGRGKKGRDGEGREGERRNNLCCKAGSCLDLVWKGAFHCQPYLLQYKHVLFYHSKVYTKSISEI